MIKINDVIVLDFFSASPYFDENQTNPVWHFIKMRKVRYEKISISKEEKIFIKYTKDTVHYRRGLRLIVVKGQMDTLSRPETHLRGMTVNSHPQAFSLKV